ncbi:tripartite tricarboxylate transporter substrate binding protein [Alcaligenes sp. SDU_A2]|uniref:tripartite tricarboxylate transporter substrate binding protein n=1 Tax=Alcaligenes sp. SDU_A2 TaxID=3136634 RepID=UPI00311F656F
MPHSSSFSRRTFLAVSALSLASAALPLPALASAWPSKPIRMIVAFPVGGPTDTIARFIAHELSQRLGQSIIVDNRPGASGSVGTRQFLRSRNDGYTISMFGMPALIAPIVHRNNLYDVRKDFTSVATVYDLPYVIVINPKLMPQVNDLQQLIAASKTQDINYSTPGAGSMAHLAMEQLKDLGGFDMLHVAYNGSAPAITDLLGGHLSVMMADTIAAMPHIQAGTLKAIALGSATGKAFLPDVQSIAEQGFPGFDVSTWSGLIVPNDTPQEVSDRLNAELSQLLAQPQLQQKMMQLGALATYEPAAQMQARINSEYERWNKVADEVDISNA